jgi:hypothetical protein
VAEWSIAPVLKTGGSKGSVSSNLTASANASFKKPLTGLFSFSTKSRAHTKSHHTKTSFKSKSYWLESLRRIAFWKS